MKYAILLVLVLGLVSCAKPKDGDNGLNGSSITGPQGPAGSDGQDGHDGQDATPVTMIPLCSDTPVYPSVFVEYGFCIGGQLYGTYSANGGFSTLLMPGTYSSNAIGSSCTFTVGAGCQVSH